MNIQPCLVRFPPPSGCRIKFASRLSVLQPISTWSVDKFPPCSPGPWVLCSICLFWACFRAPLHGILRVVHLARPMRGCRTGLLFLHLKGPLAIKEEHASPTQTNATLGQVRWQPALGWHSRGRFHGSLKRRCSRAPACPPALLLPVLLWASFMHAPARFEVDSVVNVSCYL